MSVLRLAQQLHKTPDEIRAMPIEDVDALLYLNFCDSKKQEEDRRISEEKDKMK